MPNSSRQNEKTCNHSVGKTCVITGSKNSHLNKFNGVTMNIKSSQFIGNQKPKTQIADFKLIKNDQEIVFRLRGQKAKTLKCLVEHKEAGCNALEIAKTFALRLSEYIRALRRDGLAGGHNLDIITKRELHVGGWHGKYVLCDQVELLRDGIEEGIKHD